MTSRLIKELDGYMHGKVKINKIFLFEKLIKTLLSIHIAVNIFLIQF